MVTLEELRAELAPIRARVDGLPVIGIAIESLRQDMRILRAAVNDIARLSTTTGDLEAMHDDINRVQTKQDELEARIITLERLVQG